ncbi:peptide chain release factor 2 [Clostridium cochlearium]|nr:peptide chain release factor 2 [Clostridium cochlearium]
MQELQNKMQEPDFWEDIKRAQQVTQEEKLIKDRLEKFNSLESRIEDSLVLIELMKEEEDISSAGEVLKELELIKKK